MSDQAVFLSKWSPQERIILAKEQLGHLYTFGSMTILIFSPFANFGNQSLVGNSKFFILVPQTDSKFPDEIQIFRSKWYSLAAGRASR